VTATYVYGLVPADAELPDDLVGLGPSGSVSVVAHEGVAAVVGDVPTDRPIGTRDDLVAHESVVDRIAAVTTVLPMRFPAVIEDSSVVEELLAPHHETFARGLEALEGTVQYTLKARYDTDVLLRRSWRRTPGPGSCRNGSGGRTPTPPTTTASSSAS
jgi:hypothetical protein